MIIKIDKNYRISVEGYNDFVLQKLRKTKAGKAGYQTLAYCASVDHALEIYSKLDVMDNNEKLTLKQYITQIRKENTKLAKMVKV